ncbi:four helix bundle protein [bacterium]|nr:four helix bundle protein [bacterium]
MSRNIRDFRELRVYDTAMDMAMEIFRVTSGFTKEEKYSLTDQIRRSSRSVCANIAEAWRKRRYRAAFVAKLSDAESEAAETQVWLEFSRKCGYLSDDRAREMNTSYEYVISCPVKMIQNADDWTLRVKK